MKTKILLLIVMFIFIGCATYEEVEEIKHTAKMFKEGEVIYSVDCFGGICRKEDGSFLEITKENYLLLNLSETQYPEFMRFVPKKGARSFAVRNCLTAEQVLKSGIGIFLHDRKKASD